MSADYIGIDGCRGGWVIAHCSRRFTRADLTVVQHLSDIQQNLRGAELVFIDIPIGLPSGASPSRPCDSLARAELRGKHSTIFSPPQLETLRCESYQEALALQRENTDSGFSVQAWNLVPKIREVRQLLSRWPHLSRTVLESHPELCFEVLGPVNEKKKSEGGQSERFAVIRRCSKRLARLYHLALERFPRATAGKDDLLDALIMLAGAKTAAESGRVHLPKRPPHDPEGLPLQIVIPRPSLPRRQVHRLEAQPATGSG